MSNIHTKFKPNIAINSKNPMRDVLENFLNKFTKQMVEEQDEVDKGWEYVNQHKNEFTFDKFEQNISKYGSDTLISLFTIAQEENLSNDTLKEILLNSIYLEQTSGTGDENFLFHVTVPEEIDVTNELNSIEGTINGKPVKNIYKQLCDLTKNPKVVEYVQSTIDNLTFSHDGSVVLEQPPFLWSAYVDEDKFKDNLTKKLDMSEQELDEISNTTQVG